MSENEPYDSIENAMEKVKIKEKCNWDNLPNELKVMCIEKTDVKTRANLMLSNRHNKMLVESIKSKHQLSNVYFKLIQWCNKLTFFVKSWRSTADYVSDGYEPRKLMDVLLNANIDEMELCAELDGVMDTSLTESLATCNKKFSIKTLHLTAAHWIDLDILQHCDEQLEQLSVHFDEDFYFYDMRTLLRIPQVIAVKRLNILFLGDYPHDNLKTVIDWLLDEVDHVIGKEIIYLNGDSLWQFLVEMTEPKRDFLHPTEKILCFRPSSPSKRVWAWKSKEDPSYNFLVVAEGSDAPNFEEIDKKRAKERKQAKD